MSRRAHRRQRLFQEYSRSLAMVRADLKGKFQCPICLEIFSERDLREGKLSLAHIFPASVGGRYVTLTCSDCNSLCGRHQEAHFHRLDKQEDFWFAKRGQRRESIKEITIAGKKLKVRMVLNPPGHTVEFHLLEDVTSPKDMQDLLGHLRRCRPGWVDIFIPTAPEYNEWLAKVSLLTSAYLTVFSYFGYLYTQSPALDKVRKQILNPSQKLLEDTFALRGNVQMSNNEPQLLLVVTPVEYQSFLVTYRDFFTLLPKTSDINLEIYSRMADLKNRLKNEEARRFRPPFDECIVLPYDKELKVRTAKAIVRDGQGNEYRFI